MTTTASGEASEAFALLGLEPDADRATIETAYRHLVAAAHPDRHGADGPGGVAAATVRTQALNEARRRALEALGRRPDPRSWDASAARTVGVTAHLRPPPPRSNDADDDHRDVNEGFVWGGDESPQRSDEWRPGCGLAVVGLALGLLAVMLVLGLTSAGRSDGVERQALGPIAARYWEAERTGDHGTVWALSERALRESVPEADFIAHLAACPRRVPPRTVYRMARRPDGLWEVEARTAGSYEPTGLQLFRREGEGEFGAVADDPAFIEFLATPLPQAVARPYCASSR